MGPETKKTTKAQRNTQQSSCSSHLNKVTENVTEQNTKVQEKSKHCMMIPTPCPHTHTLIKSNRPHLSYPLIICNNNTMDMAFLVHMKQSKEV